MRSRGFRYALLTTWLLTLPAAAQTRPGPGRIAVGGAFPTGYVGTLARFGLPRDLLSDDQLADPAALAKYQVVLVAGAPTTMADYGAAFDKVLAAGGAVLLDFSSPSMVLRDWLNRGAPPRGGSLLGLSGRSRSPLRPAAGSPLAADVVESGGWPASRMSFIPYVPPDSGAQTLVEFTASTPLGERVDPRELFGGGDRRLERPDTGPPAPAIVVMPRGGGQLALCGPALGLATSVLGEDYDALLLGLVRVLSKGRAVPQLAPEGPHLGRKQSLRTQDDRKEALPADEPPAAEPVGDAPPRPLGPGTRGKLPAGYTLAEAEPSEEYDLRLKLPRGGAEVVLNYWNSANFVKVSLTPSAVSAARTSAGRARGLLSQKVALTAGTPVVLKVRSRKLVVLAGSTLATADLSGLHHGQVGLKGVGEEFEFQGVEPVWFTDDFMRTNDQQGGWETSGGRWETAPVQNPDMGANPFSYKIQADTPAWALNGYPFWDEYRFSAALRPGSAGGLIGLGVLAQDAENQLRFVARVRDGERPEPDGFRLQKLQAGRITTLASVSGGLQQNQWYQVDCTAETGRCEVRVDGVVVLRATDTSFTSGKIALYAEECAARFDDVAVESVADAVEREARLVGQVPDYAGLMDVDSWAGPATPWEPDPETAGAFWRRNTFFGDVRVDFDLSSLPDGAAAQLVCDGDGRSPTTGYGVDVQRDGARATVQMLRWGKPVARAAVPFAAPFRVSLKRAGEQISGLVNQQQVVSCSPNVLPGGGRVAFLADGWLPKVSAVDLASGNLVDFTFDAAPVDWWVSSGEWDVTNRWSCTPDWSWFGGLARGVASIWLKQPLEGDQVLDFYAGPKMLDSTFGQKERVGDFNAVLCGDGKSVDSGYAFVVGPAAGGAEIRRKGQLVARNDRFRLFTRGHNRWANVRCERHGPQLLLYVDGQLILEARDAQPLPAGHLGLWTQNNGVMLPRITISYERTGSARLSLPAAVPVKKL
ncbi:MAG: hypothetical protein IT204_13995 [Fimbriimonadaceae bacterium]|nr:hypothetical protein [Fimbriimonadaceae bacterium]